MEKIHANMHVFVLSCQFVTCKHKNMHVSMYFLHLVLTFTPHYIITDKGILQTNLCSMPYPASIRKNCSKTTIAFISKTKNLNSVTYSSAHIS